MSLLLLFKGGGGGTTVPGSFTADAVIKKTGNQGSFTADSLIKKLDNPGSFTAQSAIKRVEPGSFAADAVIKKTGNLGSFTADAVLKKTTGTSFTAEAVLKKTTSTSFAAESVLKKTTSTSFSADASIRKVWESSFAADSVFKKTESGSFAAEAVLVTAQTRNGSFTADSVIKRLEQGSFVASSVIKRTGNEGSFTAESAIKRTVDGSFTASAVLEPSAWGDWSSTWNNYVESGVFGSFTAEAVIKRTESGSISAQALIRRIESGSVTAESVLKKAEYTFNTWFEPENARAALAVLQAAGYGVHLARPRDGERPLCCGRTFLTSGFAGQAREEAQRLIDVLAPFAARGVSIIGLEPSCLLSLRDEIPALFPGEATRDIASQALLFEEFLASEHATCRLKLVLKNLAGQSVLLHGHCHQKAFGAMASIQQTLKLVPGLDVQTIESGCCGMAGAFGYEAEHRVISMRMGEMDLLPAVRAAPTQAWVVADGTSCRSQIRDGAQRNALHVARVLGGGAVIPAR